MKLVRPNTLDAGLTLVSTNVAAEHPTYNPATTYAKDAKVISGRKVFESLQAGNLGKPVTDPAWWIDLGAANAFAMFDQYNGTQTLNAGSIAVELTATGRIDTLALLNVSAASVHLKMSTTLDGVIHEETRTLVSASGINNWHDYFYEPIIRLSDCLFYGLPNFANPTLEITITAPAGTAKAGVAIIGQGRDLGDTTYGAQTGIQDYSKKTTDEFGNFQIIKRAYAKRGTFKLVVDNARVDALSDMLATYRAEPMLWIGSEQYASTWVYGFYRDFSVEITFPNQSYLNLELEGLT